MKKSIPAVRNTLLTLIQSMEANPCPFVKNPKTDFTRSRKLSLSRLLLLLTTMAGKSLKGELLDFFDYAPSCPSPSALSQQRDKLLPEAFIHLFEQFTQTIPTDKVYHGYRLLAVDGSDVNLPYDPQNAKTHRDDRVHGKGYNQLHLNALFDLCNKHYVDAVVQPAHEKKELRAAADMVARSSIQEPTIIVADRGYEGYNLLGHCQEKNWNYVVRVKDKNSTGILSGLSLPEEDTYDISVDRILTKKKTKEIKNNKTKYRILAKKATFDFLDLETHFFYPLSFRVVRFPISENSYECLITNLPKEEFPIERIQEIYQMRWGIETSFRTLKYAVGLTCFHGKKENFIMQEIYGRLLMYNYCQLTVSKVVLPEKKRKHEYQINLTIAVAICREYLRRGNKKERSTTFQPEILLSQHILPIRQDRQAPRKVKPQSTVSFIYRIA